MPLKSREGALVASVWCINIVERKKKEKQDMKQNRLRLFSSHRRCPMKWVVAAVAALLCSAHAEAQERIFFEDFEGADDLPAVASPTNGGTSLLSSSGQRIIW